MNELRLNPSGDGVMASRKRLGPASYRGHQHHADRGEYARYRNQHEYREVITRPVEQAQARWRERRRMT